MKLSSDILFQDLAKHFSLATVGRKKTTLSLEPPVFYYADMPYEDNKVYIGRIGELPPPPENISCQIICVGGRLPALWDAGNSCAFSIVSEADLLRVFNIVQNTFLRYSKWDSDLYHLLNTTANLEEMIRLTSEILGKSISLVNNQLEIVVQAISDENRRLPPSWEHMLPSNVRTWADTHKKNTSFREPFFFLLEGYLSYCINIFIRDSYWGMIAISAEQEDPTSWIVVLFDHFFEVFRLALSKNLNHGHGTLVTLRSVFSDLLNCLPVTPAKLEKACLNSGHRPAAWICAALRPTGSMEHLPPEYFSKQLEQLFTKSYAAPFSGHIALFFPLTPEEFCRDGYDGNTKEALYELEEGLNEFDVRAGISLVYEDILKSHDYFRQAMIALETADSIEIREKFCYFEDYALSYALKNSIGELRPELMMPCGLAKLLQESREGADYWKTLEFYLDHEMNASRTARELFIHRTTLQNRLSRISRFVDLDSPESRMYLRYCIYLYRLFQNF
ncbi:MAG: PucR family transcriptional regulator [Lachnospiraceae bacterium]|nr:PucR family transcriptional regulator [Lachnospiraceae bacterium]